jgi:hypothetical protein
MTCEEASKKVQNGEGVDWCERGTCPQRNAYVVEVNKKGIPVARRVKCECITNWKMLPRGVGKRGRGSWAKEGFHELEWARAKELKELMAGKYGPNRCYVHVSPRAGCKCKCWLEGDIEQANYPKNWHWHCKTNGVNNVWSWDHPKMFDPGNPPRRGIGSSVGYWNRADIPRSGGRRR